MIPNRFFREIIYSGIFFMKNFLFQEPKEGRVIELLWEWMVAIYFVVVEVTTLKRQRLKKGVTVSFTGVAT